MPDLTQTLAGSDPGFLRIVADAWGIELNATDAASAVPQLTAAILDRQLLSEVVTTLPESARQALNALSQNGGRMPWALFCRRFGETRVMGAARRDRERPDLNPAAPSEVLWYRALIGKAFMDLPPEPQEFVYIPDDLLDLIDPAAEEETRPPGRPASPLESSYPIAATDGILDECCTLLAALRCGRKDVEKMTWRVPLRVLLEVLRCGGMLSADGVPSVEGGRPFLEAPRAEALAILVREWTGSRTFNELRLIPGLRFEGNWTNDPFQARQGLFGILGSLPQQSWWSLNAFIAAIKEKQPDFLRPAGDYDSWFIYDEKKGTYLRGYASWEDVDGRWLRFMISGPLYWLGLIDLAATSKDKEVTAFRPSAWSQELLHGKTPGGLQPENGVLQVGMDGCMRLTPKVPRAYRYLAARFCDWEDIEAKEIRYRLTPSSLERARHQGLEIRHLNTLLRKSSPGQVPPALLQALERWDKLGVQASMDKAVLLRAASKEVVDALRRSRAARFLGEQLNETTIIIKAGGEHTVRDVLVESGYLPDFHLEDL